MIRERAEIKAFLRRLRTLAILIVALIAGGTIGLALTEHDSVWDSFQWTLDTIATIGSHPRPETVGGQIVKVLITVLGVGTLLRGQGIVMVLERHDAGVVFLPLLVHFYHQHLLP